MKTTSRISTLIIAITGTGMLAFGGATTAHAQALRAFNATLNQSRLVSEVCNGSVCDIMFEGNGTVNIMGHVTVTTHVVQDFSGYPCNTGTAEATFVGATGQFSGIIGGGSDQGTIAGNGPNVHSSGVVSY
jgi:hypothetical protein